jgi:hypothetical protein
VSSSVPCSPMTITFDRKRFGRMAEVDPPHEIVGDMLENDLQASGEAREWLLAWLASPGPPDEDGLPSWAGNTVVIEHGGDVITLHHQYAGAASTTISVDDLVWAVRQWGEFIDGRLGGRATVERPASS